MKTRHAAGFALAGLLVAASATGSDEKDVVDTAVALKDHTILAAAIKEAALVELLKGKGPYTVFAPTDAAFKKLGDDRIKAILKDRELLAVLVKSHVVPGRVSAAELVKLDGKEVETLSKARFAVSKDGPSVGRAKVVSADVKCSNGVVHVVDAVLVGGP